MPEHRIRIFEQELEVEEAVARAINDSVVRTVISRALTDGVKIEDLERPEYPIFVAYIRDNFRISNPDNVQLIIDTCKDILVAEREVAATAAFEEITAGQFPTTEERIAEAKRNLKDFLSGKTPAEEEQETTFVRLYLELLEACGLDETRAAQVFTECVDE